MPSGKTTSNARRQSVIPPTDRTEHMPFLMSGRTPLTHSLTLLCRPAGTYFCRANPQVIVLVITVDNWVHDAGKELLACIAVFLQLKHPRNIRQTDNSETNQLDDILYTTDVSDTFQYHVSEFSYIAIFSISSIDTYAPSDFNFVWRRRVDKLYSGTDIVCL